MVSLRHSFVTLLVIGVARAQFYGGPPGHTPGNPIGAGPQSSEYGAPSVSAGLTPDEYNAPSSYGAPAQSSSSAYGAPQQSSSYGAPSQSSYGAPQLSSDSQSQSYGAPGAYSAPATTSYGVPSSPASSSSYGAPSGNVVSNSYGAPEGGSRYRVVPSSNYALPEQHSNLIRYIVLKEFRLGPNGSASPLQIDEQLGLGRNSGGSASGGYPGSMEIMKVEMPGSEEIRNSNAGGYSDNNTDEDYDEGGEEDNSVDDDEQKSSDSTDDGDNQDNETEEEDDIDNNSVDGSTGQRASASSLPSTNPRQGGGSRIPIAQVVPARGVDLSVARRPSQSSEAQAFMFSDPESGEVRRQSTNRNRNQASTSGGVRNQLRNTVNRNRQRTQNRNRNQNSGRNQNRNRPSGTGGSRNRNTNRNRNRNRNQNRPSSSSSAGAGGSDNLPPIDQLTDALALVARYFSAQAQLLRTTGQDGGLAGSLLAPNSYSNINGSGPAGPYPASGQSESGTASAFSAGGEESATQATLPASTYGPPPGSPGFGGQGQASLFPNLAAAAVRPIQQFAGFKSALLNQVVTGLSGIGQGAGRAKGEAGGLFAGIGQSVGQPGGGSANLNPVYGPPASGSGGAGVGGLISGVKGSIVNTIGNKGRAVVGIIGTKGKFAANTLQTKAHIATKGLAQTGNNVHEAFSGVIKHIQSIFDSNPNLANSGRW